jgi:hypothetical protein
MIMIHAIKTESKSIFSDYPHQSDYLSAYSGDDEEQAVQSTNISASLIGSSKKLLKKLLPLESKSFIDGQRQLLDYSFSNSRFYKRWYP